MVNIQIFEFCSVFGKSAILSNFCLGRLGISGISIN